MCQRPLLRKSDRLNDLLSFSPSQAQHTPKVLGLTCFSDKRAIMQAALEHCVCGCAYALGCCLVACCIASSTARKYEQPLRRRAVNSHMPAAAAPNTLVQLRDFGARVPAQVQPCRQPHHCIHLHSAKHSAQSVDELRPRRCCRLAMFVEAGDPARQAGPAS